MTFKPSCPAPTGHLLVMNNIFRVGIIGAGHIAEKAAKTLAAMQDAECLAVGSRSLEKAQAFAAQFGIPRPYGSYDELLADPDVDLVYIALPHSLHFEWARRAVLAGKPCLVEKSFMMNAGQAREILSLARERGVLVAEAIWTRYLPIFDTAREILGSGVIGRPVTLTSSLGYNVSAKERVQRPELGGGALLDLGVYCLTFVRMFGGAAVAGVTTHCTTLPTGCDGSESIVLELENGILATCDVTALAQGCNISVIAGETGYLVFNDTIHPTKITLMRKDHVVERVWEVPLEVTGFEYQFRACRDAIRNGQIELPQMPHSEIIYVMELMDRLRSIWGVKFPTD